MTSLPQSPTRIRPASRDTGFPEPFCGQRNTTLPHPEADLSPNACISADDVAVARVLSRTRRSFLARHKRTISHGLITSDTERSFITRAGMGGHHGHSGSLDSRISAAYRHQMLFGSSPLAGPGGEGVVETPVGLDESEEDDNNNNSLLLTPTSTTRKQPQPALHDLVTASGRLSKDGADSLNRTDTTSAGSVADGGEEEGAALRKAAAVIGDESPRPGSSRRRSMLRVFGFGK